VAKSIDNDLDRLEEIKPFWRDKVRAYIEAL
jgi:hypothetical protein